MNFLFKLFGFIWVVSVLSSLSTRAADSKNPILELTNSDGKKISLTLKELKENFDQKSITVKSHPAYAGKLKSYIGVDFLDLLSKYDPELKLDGEYWLEIETEDGWKAPLYSSDLWRKSRLLLALKETPNSLKEPISKDGLWSLLKTSKKVFYPGPLYLVWNETDPKRDIMPMQVATVKVLKKRPTEK